MEPIEFVETVERICRQDSRYDPASYFFVREALDFTIKLLRKPRHGPDRHVKGTELLEGIRKYALQEFGPLTHTVLTTWGVKRTADFGEIVFNLVDAGLMGKTDQDTRQDFADVYDFEEAFRHPFLPNYELREKGPRNRRKSRGRRGETPPGASGAQEQP